MSISTAQLQTMLARLTKAGTPAPTLNPVSLESDLHQQISDYCQSKGWLVVHSAMHRKATTAIGTPDYVIGADNGVTYWVEVKRPGSKPTTAQLGKIAWAIHLGHRAAIVYGFQEFLELVKTAPSLPQDGSGGQTTQQS